MSSEPLNRILVVEDTLIMADVLKRSLSRAGFDPTVARNGVEASDLVTKFRFDAVVTDFRMPRMNGDEFVRNMRMTPLNCDVPVVFVSSRGLEVDTEQMRVDLGIRVFLYKPFSPSELITVLNKCLKSHQQGSCIADLQTTGSAHNAT